MLARKCLNANVSCYLTVANGIYNMLFYLEIWPDVPLDCPLSFQLLINQEAVR